MTCRHSWVVFSTALEEGWLMLQCTKCGLHGTVDDPTLEVRWTPLSRPKSSDPSLLVCQAIVADERVGGPAVDRHVDAGGDLADVGVAPRAPGTRR